MYLYYAAVFHGRGDIKKLKVIFLDIDGVMNSVEDYYSFTIETDKHFKLLARIVDKTGANIVLSSTWRMFEEDRQIVHKRLQEFNMDFISCTPATTKELTKRGDQIREWLKSNPDVEHFVILDDDSDMCEYMSHLVKTNKRVGLQESDVERAIAILNKEQ